MASRPRIGLLMGVVAGFILVFLTFQSLMVLCEFGDCKVSAWFLPALLFFFCLLIGYLLDVLFAKILKK